MGDEGQYLGALDRLCPDCGDRLAKDARRCVCGWVISGKSTKRSEGPQYDHTCRWQYGQLSCKYPVGRFDQGEIRGLCIFHRDIGKGPQAARIAEESQRHTPEQYVETARRVVYTGVDNPAVAKLRAQLKPRPSGDNALSKWLPRREEMRQPGQDEGEA